MKKILYIITQSEMGGAQKNVLDLATEFRNRYDVLVAAGPDGDDKLFKQLADNKIRWHKLKWLRRSATNPFRDMAGLIEILRLLIREKPDVIHLHSSKAGFLGSIAGKIAGVKTIYTVHGAVFESPFSQPARKLFLLMEKCSSRFKDKIICVSANDKKLWLSHKAAPERKLITIHNGLDFNKTAFLNKAESREYLASQSANLFETINESNNNLKIVGTIANFFPEKGLPYLIETADIIVNQKQLKNIIFAVIGDGANRSLLEEIIKARNLQNRFILIGAIANAQRYLKAFDVFALPSIKEGFPYSLLEAMAAGVPIVASRIGGVPEIITDNVNGFLISPRNSDALAKKIMELINNETLSQKFTEAAQQKIQEFSIDKMVAATEKTYWE